LRNAAKTTVYPLRIQDMAARSGWPKAVRISGKAMLTMNRSKLAKKAAVDTMTTVAAGRVESARLDAATCASSIPLEGQSRPRSDYT
jgi:hypothetical protein